MLWINNNYTKGAIICYHHDIIKVRDTEYQTTNSEKMIAIITRYNNYLERDIDYYITQISIVLPLFNKNT